MTVVAKAKHFVNVNLTIDHAFDVKQLSVKIIRRVYLLHINLYFFPNNQMRDNLYIGN